MVLPHEGQISVVQPNLNFQDEKEDIINQLNTLAWKIQKSLDQYRRVIFSLEREEANVEYWGGDL